jgi:hypothetical protein
MPLARLALGRSGGSFLDARESVAEAPRLCAGVDDVRSVSDAVHDHLREAFRSSKPSTPRTECWPSTCSVPHDPARERAAAKHRVQGD